MASFDRQDSLSMIDPGVQKFPIRRLEPSLDRFLKVLGAALDRLYQHKTYIIRYDKRQDWESLDRELINATRTIQQIKANMREIERTRRQVVEEDQSKFDSRIQAIKDTASADVAEFITMSNDLTKLAVKQRLDREAAKENQTNEKICSTQTDEEDMPSSSLLLADDIQQPTDSPSTGSQQTQLQPLPEESDVMESWDTLQESLEELNSLVHHFATAVHEQQEPIDRIEENIVHASNSVWEGVKQLGQAAKSKSAIIPLTGALLGAVVAGPVGLLVGAKIGGLAAIGGGVAGAASGKILQKRQDQIVETEMVNMSRRTSDDGTCIQKQYSLPTNQNKPKRLETERQRTNSEPCLFLSSSKTEQ
ncbi:hypothetical protein ScPMuIL_016892 [Solemya velum]